MLKDRLRTSAVLISIILVLLYLDGAHSKPGAEGLWLLPLLLFFSLGTARDMSGLLAASNRLIASKTTLFATAIVTLSACIPLLWPLVGETYPVNCPVGRLGWIVIASVTAIFIILLREMKDYGIGPEGAIERTCNAVFVSLYAGLPMALLVCLRSLGSGNWGLAALLTMILVTKSTDAGAYFTGKAIGKHKLIPRLSPGKTKEGSLGGILTATIVAFVCLQWLFPWVAGGGMPPGKTPSITFLANPLWGAAVLGPTLALTGMIGDLAESLFKRDCGAKDSGSWLPGLGGVWDVTDSLIAAIAPAFLCFAAGVGG
ncbi:MAG: phosphatidate cytidylyltransferase [Planctomycetota bacterium]